MYKLIFFMIILLILPISNQTIKFKIGKTFSNNFIFYGPSFDTFFHNKSVDQCRQMGYKLLDFKTKGLEEEAVHMFKSDWNWDGSLSEWCFWSLNGSCVIFRNDRVEFNTWPGKRRFICFRRNSDLITYQTLNSTPSTHTTTFHSSTHTTTFHSSTHTTTFHSSTNTNTFHSSTNTTTFHSSTNTTTFHSSTHTRFVIFSSHTRTSGNHRVNKALAIGLGVAIPLLFIITMAIVVMLIILFKCNKSRKNKEMYDDVQPDQTDHSTFPKKNHLPGNVYQSEKEDDIVYESDDNENDVTYEYAEGDKIEYKQEESSIPSIHYNEDLSSQPEEGDNYGNLNDYQAEMENYEGLEAQYQ